MPIRQKTMKLFAGNFATYFVALLILSTLAYLFHIKWLGPHHPFDVGGILEDAVLALTLAAIFTYFDTRRKK